MRELTQRRGLRQFVKFGMVGASGFVVNFVIAHALQKSTTLPFQADFAIGFMSGGVSNYFLNRYWTFRSTGNTLVEMTQFLLVSAVSLAAGELVWWALGSFGKTHFSTTWFIATLAGMVINFFVNKYWTFKEAL